MVTGTAVGSEYGRFYHGLVGLKEETYNGNCFVIVITDKNRRFCTVYERRQRNLKKEKKEEKR